MYRIFGFPRAALLILAAASQLPAETIVHALVNAYDQNGYHPVDTGELAALSASAASGPWTDFGGTFESSAFVVFASCRLSFSRVCIPKKAEPASSTGIRRNHSNRFPLRGELSFGRS